MPRQAISSPERNGSLTGEPRAEKTEQRGQTSEDRTRRRSATRKAVVHFTSTPEGAVVLVDGQLVCQATPCSEAVAVGRHTVSMQAKNYLKRKESLSLARGTDVSWKLTPDFGWVTVDSVPAGLDVRVDGKVVGKTPLSRHEVSPGGHEVLVTSPCHYDSGERVAISRDEERTVAVKLAPWEGAIEVRARDEKGNAIEADVCVDGTKVGRAPGVFRVNICAREVEVRSTTGSWKKAPSAREKTTMAVEAVLESRGSAGIEWVYSQPAGIYFARTETTVAQYRACVEAGACDPSHLEGGKVHCNGRHADRVEHPMNCVDLDGAARFCTWAGGRLPTEEEWQSEASNKGRRTYPWGEAKPSCARCVIRDSDGNGCGMRRTWPVCGKGNGNSVSGLCDLAGNVWEWTTSVYDEKKGWRVLRGGSWYYGSTATLRASHRGGRDPHVPTPYIGFRCVR